MDGLKITISPPAISRLLLRAAWAPLSVYIIHAVVIRTSLRQTLDFPMHFAGGAAIAFFLFHLIGCFAPAFAESDAALRYLFSFALACTVGLFWEYGELFSDVFLHTHIQQSLHETMMDLIADTVGASASLVLVAILLWLRPGRRLLARKGRPGFQYE